MGTIEVGEEMRRRHPPEYFNGLGAPEHCEREALEIFHQQLEATLAQKKDTILCSGQPRRVSQIDHTRAVRHKYDLQLVYVVMNPPEEVLLARLQHRFEPGSEAYKLSEARIKNDKIQLFDVLVGLLARREDVWTINQSFGPDAIARDLVELF